MDLQLTDRVAFVAGASSGLGKAVAGRLLQEGCRVALCSRSPDRITAAADDLAATVARDAAHDAEALRARLLPLACDVTDEAQVRRSLDHTAEHFGALHLLVTNAGGPPMGTTDELASDAWRDALERNLMSAIHLVRHALPHLRAAARDGDPARILMITSVSAKQPVPGLALSNTARAGVQGFAKSLSEEVGPEGIAVNTILPGYTRTERLEELAASIQARTGRNPEAIAQGWAEHTALRRIGTPEEFAAAAAFLLSPVAGYVTGVALPVDGGRSKHVL